MEQNKEKGFEEIRAKISELVDVEKIKKENNEPVYNATLAEVDPEVLEEEDLEIFEDFLNHTLTIESFGKYKEKNEFFDPEKPDKKMERRGIFVGYLNNALMRPENLKWYDPEEYKQFVDLGIGEE